MIPKDQFLSLPSESADSVKDGILAVLRAYPNMALTERELAAPLGYLTGEMVTDNDRQFLEALSKLLRSGAVTGRFLGWVEYYALADNDGTGS